MARVAAHQEELKAAGAWVFFGALTDASSATVVHAADGEVSMTDGPYAEAKEQMADELPEWLGPVLATIYLIYTEGHSATAGDDLLRPALTGEAIRIGRTLVALLPDEPEAVGLLALMLLTEARAPARLGEDGELVRLADQDRSRWDRELIA